MKPRNLAAGFSVPVALVLEAGLRYSRAMMILRALWSGNLPLGKAFWTWVVIVGIPFNLATSLLFLLLVMADQLWPAFFAGYLLSVPYNVVAVVGVWRSAARYEGEPRHADLARVATVAVMLLLTLT